MTIQKKPAKKLVPAKKEKEKAVDDFIKGAPDAVAVPPSRAENGRKVQICTTISEPLLERVDKLAAQLGQRRAAIISLALIQMLESGLKIDSDTY